MLIFFGYLVLILSDNLVLILLDLVVLHYKCNFSSATLKPIFLSNLT